MSLSIVWTSHAAKQRDKLPRDVRERIIDALERFATAGVGDIKRMRGPGAEFRLRVGDWRLIFAVDATKGELQVLAVAHRREAYR